MDLVTNALFYGTIMFCAGCFAIWGMKWSYLRNVRLINTDFANTKDSKLQMPTWNLDINSAFNWNAITVVIIVILSFVYSYFHDTRNLKLENEIKQLRTEIQDCKLTAEKELLMKLKTIK